MADKKASLFSLGLIHVCICVFEAFLEIGQAEVRYYSIVAVVMVASLSVIVIEIHKSEKKSHIDVDF